MTDVVTVERIGRSAGADVMVARMGLTTTGAIGAHAALQPDRAPDGDGRLGPPSDDSTSRWR